jgi:hypothetical protein
MSDKTDAYRAASAPATSDDLRQNRPFESGAQRLRDPLQGVRIISCAHHSCAHHSCAHHSCEASTQLARARPASPARRAPLAGISPKAFAR